MAKAENTYFTQGDDNGFNTTIELDNLRRWCVFLHHVRKCADTFAYTVGEEVTIIIHAGEYAARLTHPAFCSKTKYALQTNAKHGTILSVAQNVCSMSEDELVRCHLDMNADIWRKKEEAEG